MPAPVRAIRSKIFLPPRNVGANGGNAGTENPKRATVRVNAVSDDENNAVLVSAPLDFMPGISNLIQKLDIQQDDQVEIRVFALHHADPTDVASQMALLFPDPNTQTGAQINQRGIWAAKYVGDPAASAFGTALSERRKRQATVIAVADARTQSVLITASKDTMEQIGKVIADLDSSAADAGPEFYIYEPQHADGEDMRWGRCETCSPPRRKFSSSSQKPIFWRSRGEPICAERRDDEFGWQHWQHQQRGRGNAGGNKILGRRGNRE